MMQVPVVRVRDLLCHEVGRADYPQVLRDPEGPLPGLHLVQHEIARTDDTVRGQIIPRLVEVVVAALAAHNSQISVHRQELQVRATSLISPSVHRSQRDLHGPHDVTSPSSPWISSSSDLISASISASERGGS